MKPTNEPICYAHEIICYSFKKNQKKWPINEAIREVSLSVENRKLNGT